MLHRVGWCGDPVSRTPTLGKAVLAKAMSIAIALFCHKLDNGNSEFNDRMTFSVKLQYIQISHWIIDGWECATVIV